MKKVLKLFVLIAVMLIALTGCVEVNYEITLNSDGSADLAYIYGFEKKKLEEMETTADEMTQDMKENAEESDFKIELFSDDEIEGFKATKHITDLSQISLEEAFGDENVKDSENNQIKIEKKGSKTIYEQKADIDLSTMDEMTGSMVKMKYTIKLPTKVGKNNASEVSEDGKTLTWNLKPGEVNKIEFEASESGAIAKIIKIVVIAMIGAALLLTVVMVIAKKCKSKKNNEVQTQTEIAKESSNVEEDEIEKEENDKEISEE